MLPEVRMARIIDAIGLHQAKKLSCVEAAELLGMSERHFRRLRDAYEAHGAEGIVDRRRGRASGRRAGVDEIHGRLRSFAPATSISRPSTSTKRSTAGPWRTERRSRAATPGPRARCSYVGSSARRPSARRIARSGRAGPCPACSYSKTARSTPGCRRGRNYPRPCGRTSFRPRQWPRSIQSGVSLIAAGTHSSFCSSMSAPTSRMTAGSFGKMPTTSEWRLISRLSRSSGVRRGDLGPVLARPPSESYRLEDKPRRADRASL